MLIFYLFLLIHIYRSRNSSVSHNNLYYYIFLLIYIYIFMYICTCYCFLTMTNWNHNFPLINLFYLFIIFLFFLLSNIDMQITGEKCYLITIDQSDYSKIHIRDGLVLIYSFPQKHLFIGSSLTDITHICAHIDIHIHVLVLISQFSNASLSIHVHIYRDVCVCVCMSSNTILDSEIGNRLLRTNQVFSRLHDYIWRNRNFMKDTKSSDYK